jgi:hypothetical protein
MRNLLPQDYLLGAIFLAFVAIATVGVLVFSGTPSRSELDCQDICHLQHTEMRGVTHFGCVCEDGHVFPASR